MRKIQWIVAMVTMAVCGMMIAVSAAEAGKKPAALTETEKAAADKAWKEVDTASKPPLPPREWASRAPSEEEREEFSREVGKAAMDGATKARDFYTKYPSHEKASDAQRKEKMLLETAARYGQSGSLEKLKDNPLLSDDDKFALRLNKVHADAIKQREKGTPAVMAEFEKGLRGLLKEFPDRPELHQQFLMLAKNTEPEKAKEIYAELLASNADEEIKAQAKTAMKVMGAVGQPFEMSFTGIDGRKVDMKDLKGKVVLIDFWATWCGPCIAELPKVKKIYNKYHDQGFEILGISFDKGKSTLVDFVKKQEMPWPQYFDGEGWGNKFGMEYGISAIPTMWLVDKNGLLQDLNAREDLDEKVAKMLAEK